MPNALTSFCPARSLHWRHPSSSRPSHIRFIFVWARPFGWKGTNWYPADVKPGGMLKLTLYWRATQRIAEKYTVFNQVLGADKRIVGQQDGQPGCEAMPTDDWPVGD